MKEFNTLQAWKDEAELRSLLIQKEEGKWEGEDPYTHWYAIKDNYRIGYFGEAHGSDGDYGVLCANPFELYTWGGDEEVLNPIN